jgi:hypothetical protein
MPRNKGGSFSRTEHQNSNVMSQETGWVPAGDAIIVSETGWKHWIYGFLSVAFAAALGRGNIGAETDAGRNTVDLVFGLLTVGTIALSWWMSRHPARLEISREKILLRHRGLPRTQQIPRTSGDLYIRHVMAGSAKAKTRTTYLCTPGNETSLQLDMFNREEVTRACLATGWRFIDPPR